MADNQTQNAGAEQVTPDGASGQDNSLTKSFNAQTDTPQQENLVDAIYGRAWSLKQEYWHISSAESYQLAIIELHKERPEDFKKLNQWERGDIGFRSIYDPPGYEIFGNYLESFIVDEDILPENSEKMAIEILYQSSPYKDYFIDTESAEFVSEITDHPALAEARENWDSMTDQEKLELAETLHLIHAEIRGFDPAKIVIDDLREGVLGNYTHAEHVMRLDRDTVQDSTFERFVNVVVHEGTHAYDMMLGKNMWAIRHQEDQWFIDNDINEFPLKQEQLEAYEEHMKNWLRDRNNLPEPDLKPPADTLLLSGDPDLRGEAMMLALTSRHKGTTRLDEGHTFEDFNPLEKSAYAAGSEVEKILKEGNQDVEAEQNVPATPIAAISLGMRHA